MAWTSRIFAALAIGGAALAVNTAQADVITLRADEWCPYNCADTGDRPGYGIEITKEIFAKAGHTIEYKTMAWIRALDECRKGTAVAVIGTSHDESPDFVFPQEHVGVSDNTLVVKKGNPWRYDGVATLERVKLGVIQGYTYGGDIGGYIKAKEKDKARVDLIGGDNGLDQNLKKLIAGRIEATLDSSPVLGYKLAQMGLADKVDLVGTADPDQIYVAFSPQAAKAKEYAEIFDKGLAEMRASGRLKEILARYSVPDWK